MPKINYVDSADNRIAVDVPLNDSVMEGAVTNGITGIVAECGGSAMCATCHVYVDDAFLSLLPEMGEVEDTMLDLTACERRENSRLSCQIRVTPELEDLVVRLPESQV